MLLDINKLPQDIRWMCHSDMMLIIIIGKYVEENKNDKFYVNNKFVRFCKQNGLRLELSTINRKFLFMCKCFILFKEKPYTYRINKELFIY